MTKEEFITKAKEKGWQPDSYGHLKQQGKSGMTYRLKIQKLAWRFERKVPMSYGPAKWINIRSMYYKKTEDQHIPKLKQ